MTFPADAEAEQVVAGLAPRLPMSDAERRCVVEVVGGDADLLGRLVGGVAADSDVFDELTGVLTRCKVRVTQAPMFAESINAGVGGSLTADQVTCLTEGFAALDAGELDAALSAVLDPKSATADAGSGVLTGLLVSCGVPDGDGS